jgi:amino acid adenylation domain-containing protein
MATSSSDLSARKTDLSAAKRALLQQRIKAKSTSAPSMVRVDRKEDLPLSHAQERLWFLHRLTGDSRAYHVPAVLRIRGTLDCAALTASLNFIIEQHEVLRTSFSDQDGTPCQVIRDRVSLTIPVTHVKSHADAMAQIDEHVREPFDIAAGPLLRAHLFQNAPDDHVFLLCLHHIVTDGWSMDLMREAIVSGYRASCDGKPHAPEPIAVQYVDYAAAQRDEAGKERITKGLAYWCEKLAGAPPLLTLQSGATRPAVQSMNGARTTFTCDADITHGVQAIANESGATSFMVTLAAFSAAVMRYTGEADFVIGTPVSGRSHPAVQRLIGCFVNTVPIRATVDCNASFRGLIEDTRRTSLEAFDHQDVPFEKIVDALKPERELGHEPICQVVFTCRENPVTTFELAPGTDATVLPYDDAVAKFDFVITLVLRPDRIEGTIDYNRDVYDDWFVQQFAEHYRQIMQCAVASPDTPVAKLSLLGEAERSRILIDWNESPVAKAPLRPIHNVVEDIVERYPDTIAVRTSSASLTYSELNRRANRVADALLERGVPADSLVALCAARGAHAVVGALGIMKAGAGFLPVDPTYPADRIAFMLEDAGPAMVVAEQEFASTNGFDAGSFVDLDEVANEMGGAIPNPDRDVSNQSLAYAIYTSGSTGKPKAALMEHAGLCNLANAQRSMFDINSGMNVLQFAPLSFDAWVWEFVMAICNGATLCIPDDRSRTGTDLSTYIDDQDVEVALLPPSVLNTLPDSAKLPTLDVLFSGGEACRAELAQRWAMGRKFFNAYGPTEATVVATVHRCEADATEAPPIGRPIDNVRTYVLDAFAQPVPVGVEGELYIGGASVARGYHRRPELNEVSFIADPFDDKTGARMYRTGDRVRWTPEGTIVYLGRADNQVKVRGFRIELGEIEAALRSKDAVHDCAAMVEFPNTPEARITAFVETHPNATRSEGDLRAHVRALLPAHMTPNVIEFVDALPKTPNDKIDRNALLHLERTGMAVKPETVQPRNETETRIAKAWCAILDRDQVCIHENFFDVGGHSLLAVKLVAALEEEGAALTLQQVFERPTIAAMAEFLEQGTTALLSGMANGRPVSESLVPIQSEGDGAPLFVIAPAGGVIFPYFHLSHLMGNDRPIYGLQDPVVVTKAEPFTSIEQYVDYYRSVVETVHPDGPYQVLGWSMGGSIAYEMARAWDAEGKDVGFVGLVDTRIHPVGTGQSYSPIGLIARSTVIILDATVSIRTQIANGFFILALRAAKSADHSSNGFYQRIKRKWASFWLRTVLRKSEFAKSIAEDAEIFHSAMPTVMETIQVLLKNGKTGKQYMPGEYGGKITLIRASERVRGEPEDASPSYGWDEFASEVEVHVVNGNHVQLFSEPTVHETAAVLRDALGRVEKRG